MDVTPILESLIITLGITEEADKAILAEILNDAVDEIKKARNYPSDMSEAEIEADLLRYTSNIKKLAKYDFSQIGAESESAHNENGTNRTFYDRAKCFDGVVPFCRQF